MPKASEQSVLLIRTGGTVWDQAERLAGSSDLPLSEEGLAHAHRMAETARLGQSPVVVLSGPEEASQQTARIIARSCNGRVRVFKGLGEVGLGLWEGLRPAELSEKYPKAYKKWRTDPSGVRVPQGETLTDARDRLIASLRRSMERYRPAQTIGVVLRPMAYGLVRSATEDRSIAELWSLVRDEPLRRLTLPRERSRLRVGTPRPRLGRAS